MYLQDIEPTSAKCCLQKEVLLRNDFSIAKCQNHYNAEASAHEKEYIASYGRHLHVVDWEEYHNEKCRIKLPKEGEETHETVNDDINSETEIHPDQCIMPGIALAHLLFISIYSN